RRYLVVAGRPHPGRPPGAGPDPLDPAGAGARSPDRPGPGDGTPELLPAVRGPNVDRSAPRRRSRQQVAPLARTPPDRLSGVPPPGSQPAPARARASRRPHRPDDGL